jgi:hypothetical protein
LATLATHQAFRRTELHNNADKKKPDNNYRLRDFLAGKHPRKHHYNRASV